MSRYDPRPNPRPRPEGEEELDPYYRHSVDAHILADMLRIESISNEVRELKETVKTRLDKLENWIVGIVGLTVTSLVAILASFIQHG